MDFRFTDEQERFRCEVREFLQNELPPEGLELYDCATDDERWVRYTDFRRKMGARGWLTVTWPEEYGGLGLGPVEQLILIEEGSYHSTTVVSSGPAWVGPTILDYGDEAQKNDILPRIAGGEIDICLGYTEPEAGSDLASLRTQAKRKDDHYIVNGQKVFTSFAHRFDYCWLTARTDLDAPKHQGLSVFLVDMKTPGISVRPLIDMRWYHSFNEVYFDDVRIPCECLVGQENHGWELMLSALNHERTGFGGGVGETAVCRRILDDLVEYIKRAQNNSISTFNRKLIKHKLAQAAIEIEVSRMLAYRLVWLSSMGSVKSQDASIAKIFGSETKIRMTQMAMNILGFYGQLKQGCPRAPFNGKLLNSYLWSIPDAIGAGTNEIQRSIVAIRGLGLAKG